jgi:nucleoside-diphosphate-sugar epimerase
VNFYAATKQAFESLAQYYIETNSIKFCSIRLNDTYGPSDNRSKIFNLWIRIAKTGETIDMTAGEQIIDITYIDDIIDAYLLLINYLNTNTPLISNGDVFFVNALQKYSLRELALIFERINNCKLNINWGGKEYRKREVMKPYENGKLIPGWKAKISLDVGIGKLFINH